MKIWRRVLRRWREAEEILGPLRWLGAAARAELGLHALRDLGGAFKAE